MEQRKKWTVGLSLGAIAIAAYLSAPHFLGKRDFDHLDQEQQAFVKNQHDKALELFKDHKYRDALTEIDKVFAVVSDYADSREIERYSRIAIKTPPAQ